MIQIWLQIMQSFTAELVARNEAGFVTLTSALITSHAEHLDGVGIAQLAI